MQKAFALEPYLTNKNILSLSNLRLNNDGVLPKFNKNNLQLISVLHFLKYILYFLDI